MATHASGAKAPTHQRGWFRRNWKWAVPLVIVLAAAIGGGIIIGPNVALKYSVPFRMIVDELHKNAALVEQVGEPANLPGLLHLPAGEKSEQDGRGTARFTFQWVGPKGSADVTSQARLLDGTWGIGALEAHVAGGATINLTKDIRAREQTDMPKYDPNAKPAANAPEAKSKPADMNVTIPTIPDAPQ